MGSVNSGLTPDEIDIVAHQLRRYLRRRALRKIARLARDLDAMGFDGLAYVVAAGVRAERQGKIEPLVNVLHAATMGKM